MTAASEGRGPVRRQVVAEEVVARITTLIAGGELAVGDKLPPERVLARELRISRPTLREGIRALAAVGIVRVKHGKGVFVAATPSDVGAHADSAGIAPAALPRLRALLFAATLSLAALRLGQASLDAIVERLASAASDDSTPGDGGRALVEGLVRLLDEPDLAPLIDLLWPGSGVPPEAGPLVDDELPRALAGRNAGRAFELAFRAFVPGPASHGS